MILSERHRPSTIDDCILTEDIKDIFRGFVKSNTVPTLLLTGSAGTGKTTVARALANELGADVLFINASLDASMDMIRTKISQFASTVSFTDSRKITILDEADGLRQDQQQALRGFIEEFSGNHSIIFTCNFVNKIIDPIKSRCKVVDFRIQAKDKPLIATKFLKRVLSILDNEGIEYEKEAVAALVMKKFPDFRSVLNEIQGYSAGGKIDAGIIASLSDEAFGQLIKALKEKKFNDVRKWVAEHSDLESAAFYRLFYDSMNEKLDIRSTPEMILMIGEHSYKSYFMVDQEINRMAFLTSVILSSNIAWK